MNFYSSFLKAPYISQKDISSCVKEYYVHVCKYTFFSYIRRYQASSAVSRILYVTFKQVRARDTCLDVKHASSEIEKENWA